MSHKTHCIDFSWLMVGGFCVIFLYLGFFDGGFCWFFFFLQGTLEHATVLCLNALAVTFSLYF